MKITGGLDIFDYLSNSFNFIAYMQLTDKDTFSKNHVRFEIESKTNKLNYVTLMCEVDSSSPRYPTYIGMWLRNGRVTMENVGYLEVTVTDYTHVTLKPIKTFIGEF